jgi:Domain of unknown function (DUF927)
MNTLEFIELVTPRQGVKVVCVQTPNGNMVNRRAADRGNLARGITALVEAGEPSIYHALAGFREGTIDKVSGRKQSNVEFLRALWLDIDVGDNKPYATKGAAVEHLGKFIEAYNLPLPMIVVSGSGLHIYWPLSEDVPRAQWKPAALQLKAATTTFGLHADPSRTADEASLLRPVGSFNNKRGTPKLVKVHFAGDAPVSIESITALLPAGAAPLPVLPNGPAFVSDLTLNTPKNYTSIVQLCPQMQQLINNMDGSTGVKVTEPSWRAGLSVIARCVDGESHAHAFSSGYPGYTHEETQGKFQRELIKDMPATCNKFDEVNPGVCGNCPRRGTIKSPVELGMNRTELPAPTTTYEGDIVSQVTGAAHGFELSKSNIKVDSVKPPYPYKRTAEGLVKIKRVNAVDENGNKKKDHMVDEEVLFSHYDIYPIFKTRQTNEDGQVSAYASCWRVGPANGTSRPSDITIDHLDLASDDTLKRVLYSRAAYTAGKNEHTEICEYMRSYMKELGDQHTHPQPRHFGWQTAIDPSRTLDEQPLEFVAGMQIFKRENIDGVWALSEPEAVYPSQSMKKAAEFMQPRGTLDGWAKAASWYKNEYAKEHIAYALMALGAPFVRYSKDAGLVIIAQGDRGSGKSLMTQLIASAWGEPSKYILGGKSTGMNGFEPVIAKYHSIPMIVDDRTVVDPNDMADEIMGLANGHGKNRGVYEGGRMSEGEATTWCTHAVMSSNTDWLNALTAVRHDREGEIARLAQINIPAVKAECWPMAGLSGENEFRRLCAANSGLVGPLLIQEFLKAPAKYVERLGKYEQMFIDYINAKKESDPLFAAVEPRDFRLHSMGVACAMLSLFILRKYKVVDWKIDNVLEVYADMIARICRITQDARPEQADVLASFINEHHGNLVMVTAHGTNMSNPDVEGPAFGTVPHSKVVGRMDHIDKVTYIDRHVFKEWLMNRGLSENAVLKGLIAEGWSLRYGSNIKATLGRGFPTASKMQTRVIELRNPNLFNQLTAERE